MRTSRLYALTSGILLVAAAACAGGDDGNLQEPATAAEDSVAPGMVTGTTGAPGPGTVGTPGTPAATDPDTINSEADPAPGL